MKMAIFKGECGVKAQAPDKSDGIRFECPKCKVWHDFNKVIENGRGE